jgi:flagellar biosynthetic protein FliO
MSILLGGVQALGSQAAEPPATSSAAKGGEHFLQQFISTALAENTSSQAVAVPPSPRKSSEAHDTVPPSLANQVPSELTAATKTMILALGAILGLLGLVAYLLRRYLLKPNPFGKRGTMLRVVARVNLAPKAAVALLEVPGKLLVVGVTGNAVTTLGEVPAVAAETAASEAKTTVAAFATTLDQHVRTLEKRDAAEDPLLQVSERIQRKVSRLKQL